MAEALLVLGQQPGSSPASAPVEKPQVCCPCGSTHDLLRYPYPSMPVMCRVCFIKRDDEETIIELLHDSGPFIGPPGEADWIEEA